MLLTYEETCVPAQHADYKQHSSHAKWLTTLANNNLESCGKTHLLDPISGDDTPSLRSSRTFSGDVKEDF